MKLTLLMITDDKQWHYLTVTEQSALVRGITLNHESGFYCSKGFNSYTTEKKRQMICKYHDYWYILMSEDSNNILKYNQDIKIPAIVCTDIESLFEKIYGCHNNQKMSSAACDYSLFIQFLFDSNKRKENYYRGKYCVKKVCEDLRNHTTEIINYEKKEMLLLTKEEKKSYDKQEIGHIRKKDLKGFSDGKKDYKVTDCC